MKKAALVNWFAEMLFAPHGLTPTSPAGPASFWRSQNIEENKGLAPLQRTPGVEVLLKAQLEGRYFLCV